VIEKNEITTSVREWKAQRAAELRLKVKLLQQELLWAIDDLERHQRLQGEALIFAANNEGVEWHEDEWLEEMRALWTIPTHPHTTTDAPQDPAPTPHDRSADETGGSSQPDAPALSLVSHPDIAHTHVLVLAGEHP
jgi:hypothetical protein